MTASLCYHSVKSLSTSFLRSFFLCLLPQATACLIYHTLLLLSTIFLLYILYFIFYIYFTFISKTAMYAHLSLFRAYTRFSFHLSLFYFLISVGNGMPVRPIHIRLQLQTDCRLSMQGLFRLKMPVLRKAVLMLHQV